MFPDDGSYLVWDKILTFFNTKNPNQKMGDQVNKIFSFWLKARTGEFLTYLGEISRRKKII